MAHEFIIQVPYQEIETTIHKLNEVGLDQLYYDLPITIIRNENGYGYVEKENELIALHVYPIEIGEKNLNIDEYKVLIHSTLNILSDSIEHRITQENEYTFELEDIELDNDWMISYSLNETRNKKMIWFEPQAAFGTGLHETTQDCLNIILEQDFTGKYVVDFGTGSGILSIAAALKNAFYIEAFDMEPVKREILHNMRLNNLHNIKITQANLIKDEITMNKNIDWVFINIGASESMAILKKHQLLTRHISNFIISGLVDWNYKKVLNLFEMAGYHVVNEKHSNQWVTLYLVKSSYEARNRGNKNETLSLV